MVRLNRLRRLAVLCVAPVLAALCVVPANATTTARICSTVNIPVSSVGTGPPDLNIVGQLCRPDWQTPRVVQLLVHGATYKRGMWDWQQNPDVYSYVSPAVEAGYATLAVDRIGHGASSHPPADQVTISAGTTALHGVVTALRAGTVGGIAFQKVVWVGHSMGAIHGWDYGGRYNDINAYIFAADVHYLKQSWLDLIKNSVQPASPPGYFTTIPGKKDDLFYRTSMADPAVIAQDEATTGTLTEAEVNESVGLTLMPPAQSPTQRIRVPVLITLGEFDNLACGPPDGLTCTKANVLALERPYFTGSPKVDAVTVSGGGHSYLHTNAPAMYWAMINWARTVAPPV
ncbi:MAG TPA: alpha/beta hydrolase [Actinophytocola sp.]|uniref:alpha/beta hydrolase n=1 Tax=Actinophytocola sp. TaxID=1872138 RepID=UPI002DDDBB16|nr:alpha/beta hydrolase [Actinophytocola sp.]HEV2779500.1 alpha/beta hydrolase [Actinophytocola sp.]